MLICPDKYKNLNSLNKELLKMTDKGEQISFLPFSSLPDSSGKLDFFA